MPYKLEELIKSMNDNYIISHTTDYGDIVYYNEKNHIWVELMDKATWYDNKVNALLVCRKCLMSYTHIRIIRIGVN